MLVETIPVSTDAGPIKVALDNAKEKSEPRVAPDNVIVPLLKATRNLPKLPVKVPFPINTELVIAVVIVDKSESSFEIRLVTKVSPPPLTLTPLSNVAEPDKLHPVSTIKEDVPIVVPARVIVAEVVIDTTAFPKEPEKRAPTAPPEYSAVKLVVVSCDRSASFLRCKEVTSVVPEPLETTALNKDAAPTSLDPASIIKEDVPIKTVGSRVITLEALTVTIDFPKKPSKVPVPANEAFTMVVFKLLRSAARVFCKLFTTTVPKPVAVFPVNFAAEPDN